MSDQDLERLERDQGADVLRPLKDRLAEPAARPLSFSRLKDYLGSKFDATKSHVTERIAQTTYRLIGEGKVGGDVSIFESRDDSAFLGALFSRRAPEALQKDGAGGTTGTGAAGTCIPTVVGTMQIPGSATESTWLVAGAYSLLYAWIESVAFGTLISAAQGAASANFWTIYGAISPFLCVAPCAPFATPVTPPAPILTTTYSRVLGVPYKVTYTAVAWQAELIECI